MQKMLSLAAMHFTIAFGVAYAMTGSVLAGGAVALVEPVCNVIGTFFHDRVWRAVEQRRNDGAAPRLAAA